MKLKYATLLLTATSLYSMESPIATETKPIDKPKLSLRQIPRDALEAKAFEALYGKEFEEEEEEEEDRCTFTDSKEVDDLTERLRQLRKDDFGYTGNFSDSTSSNNSNNSNSSKEFYDLETKKVPLKSALKKPVLPARFILADDKGNNPVVYTQEQMNEIDRRQNANFDAISHKALEKRYHESANFYIPSFAPGLEKCANTNFIVPSGPYRFQKKIVEDCLNWMITIGLKKIIEYKHMACKDVFSTDVSISAINFIDLKMEKSVLSINHACIQKYRADLLIHNLTQWDGFLFTVKPDGHCFINKS